MGGVEVPEPGAAASSAVLAAATPAASGSRPPGWRRRARSGFAHRPNGQPVPLAGGSGHGADNPGHLADNMRDPRWDSDAAERIAPEHVEIILFRDIFRLDAPQIADHEP